MVTLQWASKSREERRGRRGECVATLQWASKSREERRGEERGGCCYFNDFFSEWLKSPCSRLFYLDKQEKDLFKSLQSRRRKWRIKAISN